MTISDSLPIKFWLSTEEGYNEEQLCGVYSDCFCQHVNFEEDITLQFVHTEPITLKIHDMEDDSVLDSVTFTSLGSNYYQLTFDPTDIIGDDYKKRIYFTVVNTTGGAELAFSECVIIGGCLTFPYVPPVVLNYTVNIYDCGACGLVVDTGILTGDDVLVVSKWYGLIDGRVAQVTGTTLVAPTVLLVDNTEYASCIIASTVLCP